MLSFAASVALVVAVLAVVLVAAVRDSSGARVTAVGVRRLRWQGAGSAGSCSRTTRHPGTPGVATLLVGRVVQAVLLAPWRSAWWRRGRGRAVAGSVRWPRWSRPTVVAVVACGVLDALANACIQAALHVGSGDATLPVVSVLNALYPIGTVVLAGVVLRERLTAVQWTGSCSRSWRRSSDWRWPSGRRAPASASGARVSRRR